MEDIDRQGVSSKEGERPHHRRAREVRKLDPSPISAVEAISEGHAKENDTEPGKEREIVQGIKALGGRPAQISQGEPKLRFEK